MFPKKLLLLLTLAFFVLSCSQLVTKQFISPLDENGKEPAPRKVGGWTFSNPTFIAYKDQPTSARIKNPNTYWLTLQAEYENKYKENIKSGFEIDSVIIYSFIEDSSYIRYPSRIAEFDSNTGKYHRKVFNFFEDQGVKFKEWPDSVLISFSADFTASDESIDFQYIMHQDIKDRAFPYLP